MPDNSGQSPQTLGNPNGHLQAASNAGQLQASIPAELGIGALNELGVNTQKLVAMHQRQEANAAQQLNPSAVATTPAQGQLATQGNEEQKVQSRQLTEKDARHVSQFITEAAQQKYDFAKLAVEADADAIYKIAETDKDLANRLLKDFDFGTNNVDELLEKKTISTAAKPEEVQKEIEDAKWKQQMEKDLLEEKILRLKGEDPEFNDEVEEKFRELYFDKAFNKYDEKQKVAISRTLTGKSNSQSSADDVALAILKREEGVVSSPRGSTQQEKSRNLSPQFKAMQKSMGVSDSMLDMLPPDIDEQINQALGPFSQR